MGSHTQLPFHIIQAADLFGKGTLKSISVGVKLFAGQSTSARVIIALLFPGFDFRLTSLN